MFGGIRYDQPYGVAVLSKLGRPFLYYILKKTNAVISHLHVDLMRKGSAHMRNIIRVCTAFVRMLCSGAPLLGVNRCLRGFVRAEFGVGAPGCRKGSLGRALKLRDMNHPRRRPRWLLGGRMRRGVWDLVASAASRRGEAVPPSGASWRPDLGQPRRWDSLRIAQRPLVVARLTLVD